MKVYTIVLGAVFALILSGCTASSLSQMTLDKDIKQKRVVLNENYQKIYKRALEKSKECYEFTNFGSGIYVDGQIYSELREAELSIYQRDAFGINMRHGAKIIGIDNNTTELTIFTYSDFFLDRIKRLYAGECVSCNCIQEDKK